MASSQSPARRYPSASCANAIDAGSFWIRRRRSSIRERSATATLWDDCNSTGDFRTPTEVVGHGELHRIHPRLVVYLSSRRSGGDLIGIVAELPGVELDCRSLCGAGGACIESDLLADSGLGGGHAEPGRGLRRLLIIDE